MAVPPSSAGGVQVNVPGSYTYTSAAGTVLGVGNGQTESVTFSPQDASDYSTMTTSVTVNVSQAVVTEDTGDAIFGKLFRRGYI